ncbi:Shugoshin 2 [Dissostichus eleginoides]|uniref:Shugoshin 2 n=1 Tax=Dissostichus eleginoides TaxID=100907 RepID=A0AAD9CP03_DISEL|nr:Shugoshin 2 [Dissostichus eleginoides]
MLPMWTMASLKPSKLTSANVTASKIKHKILNTSSFFKVSLKTNNKALAVALEVQKERSRQLEMDIVHYQKQVEALCFELATKKYKQRKLLLIMDTLRSDTLKHLDMVDELFSDGDKVPEDNKTSSCGINNENLLVESPTGEQPPQPEMAQPMLCPFQKEPADLPEKNTDSNVANILNRPRESTDAFNDIRDPEKRRSSQLVQIPQRGKSRPSSSLREEL